MKSTPSFFIFISAIFLFSFNQDLKAQSQPEKPTVKIGAILPLTGDMASVGETFRDAIQMALDEIPKDSKFHYEMIFEDDSLQAAKTAVAANKLISVDKVDALISMWSYGGNVVNPLAERSHTLHFGFAWDPNVAKGTVSFIHCTPPRVTLKGFFDAFAKKGWKKFALIGVKEAGSIFCFNEFERMAKAAGIEVVYREAVNFDEHDFRTLIAKARETKPDAYFINMGTPMIELIVRQMKEMNIQTPVEAITGFDVAEDLHQLEGKWYVSDSYVPGDFANRFIAKYGSHSIYGAGNYYDIIRLIVYAYEHLPSTTKPSALEMAKLIQTQYASQFPSAFGKIEIGADHIISYPAQLMMIKNGKRIPITMDELP